MAAEILNISSSSDTFGLIWNLYDTIKYSEIYERNILSEFILNFERYYLNGSSSLRCRYHKLRLLNYQFYGSDCQR